ncbi:ester cyclase [Aureivirga sp. CE67]|uniref:ester cyclase n=1 Tax=Aureivirga sp. CE67 TaxID=1788983 RepID=UPI002104C0C0|nr:ester cyclase [Aureivirga sp. CE67]
MTSKKKDIVKTLVNEVFMKNKVEYYDTLFTKNMVSHQIFEELDINDVEGLRQLTIMFHECFSDVKFEIEELIESGNKVFALLKVSAVHDGEKFMGIEPKGKKFIFDSYDIFYFEKGLIAYHKSIANVVQQLEMLK